MTRALLIAAALCAVAATAQAKMECHPNPYDPSLGQSCSDPDAQREGWVKLFCTYHPSESHCAALGYRPASADPVDQRVDQRLVDHACAANPGILRCVSPWGQQ